MKCEVLYGFFDDGFVCDSFFWVIEADELKWLFGRHAEVLS